MHAETATVGTTDKTWNTYAASTQTSGLNQPSHKISQFTILSFTMKVSSVIHLWVYTAIRINVQCRGVHPLLHHAIRKQYARQSALETEQHYIACSTNCPPSLHKGLLLLGLHIFLGPPTILDTLLPSEVLQNKCPRKWGRWGQLYIRKQMISCPFPSLIYPLN